MAPRVRCPRETTGNLLVALMPYERTFVYIMPERAYYCQGIPPPNSARFGRGTTLALPGGKNQTKVALHGALRATPRGTLPITCGFARANLALPAKTKERRMGVTHPSTRLACGKGRNEAAG